MRSALWALLPTARPSDSPAASAESGRGVLAARSRRQSSTSTEDYATWRRGVEAELQRQHGIAFEIIPEGGWTRLYVKGLSPEQAANADEIRKYYARSRAIGYASKADVAPTYNVDATTIGRLA